MMVLPAITYCAHWYACCWVYRSHQPRGSSEDAQISEFEELQHLQSSQVENPNRKV